MSNFSDGGRPVGTALAGRAPAKTARVMLGSEGGVAGVLQKVLWRASGPAGKGIVSLGRGGLRRRAAAEEILGSLASGGGVSRGHKRREYYFWKGLKLLRLWVFSPLLVSPVCYWDRECPERPSPERTPLLSGAVCRHGGKSCEIGSRFPCSRKLLSNPGVLHTSMVSLVRSYACCFSLSLLSSLKSHS